MRTLRLWPATLALISLPAAASAQPVGSEFQVNTFTSGAQVPRITNAVAADANGNFVVVWHSIFQDGSGFGVFGQRYDSTGARVGAEFRVNSYTTGDQLWPAVASDASRTFTSRSSTASSTTTTSGPCRS